MKIGFFGHSNISLTREMREIVKNKIVDILKNNENVEFFLGGYGVFDFTCASILKELKNKYTNFKSIFVTPYISETYLKNNFSKELYDDCIYPPLENTPKKIAIIKRNYWIVDNCDFLIFNVSHSISGAYKILEYAQQRKVKHLNIGDKKTAF